MAGLHLNDFRRLMDLLIKAAGAEDQKVRAITCHCSIDGPPQFTIETIGDQKHVYEAVPLPDAMLAPQFRRNDSRSPVTDCQ
jgi:hypothetical protein